MLINVCTGRISVISGSEAFLRPTALASIETTAFVGEVSYCEYEVGSCGQRKANNNFELVRFTDNDIRMSRVDDQVSTQVRQGRCRVVMIQIMLRIHCRPNIMSSQFTVEILGTLTIPSLHDTVLTHISKWLVGHSADRRLRVVRSR